MAEHYKFRSDITKSVLPTGYIHTGHVTRDEVPEFLNKIIKKARCECGNWGELFIKHQLGIYDGWHIDSIKKRFLHLGSDICELQKILNTDKELENDTTS